MVSLVNWNTFRNGEWGFIAVGRACWPNAPLCGRVLVGRVRRTRLSADGLARSASTPYLFPRHLNRWNAIPIASQTSPTETALLVPGREKSVVIAARSFSENVIRCKRQPMKGTHKRLQLSESQLRDALVRYSGCLFKSSNGMLLTLC